MESLVIKVPQEKESSIVQEILNNHLKTQGKLFRPYLTAKLAALFSLKEEDYYHISEAGELIHNASLIHDDVVDQASFRRNRPTLNAHLPNSKAVLAGDYLLASVIANLVSIKKFDTLKTLAEVLEEMVEGEFIQDSLRHKESVTKEDLLKVSSKKTGALIAWNCHSVAVTANQSQEIVHLCHKLGMKIGLAFQLYDDNIDYSFESGKEYAKDLKEGLINFTTLNLIKLYPELLYPVYQLRGQNFSFIPWNQSQIQKAVDTTKAEIDVIYQEIYQLVDEIVELAKIEKNGQAYEDFITFLKLSEQRTK
ncbi:MAG: polyprenyl synthetase family protein [Bacteriovoracaceae bacterium]